MSEREFAIKMEELFVNGFREMQRSVSEWAERKGWNKKFRRKIYEESENALRDSQIEDDGNEIALMHSELSEALEGMRSENPPSDKIPQFSSVEEEYADTIIRIMQHAEARGLRIAEALVAKMAYNEGRPYMHGRKF